MLELRYALTGMPRREQECKVNERIRRRLQPRERLKCREHESLGKSENGWETDRRLLACTDQVSRRGEQPLRSPQMLHQS
jgi:hypothetical protein